MPKSSNIFYNNIYLPGTHNVHSLKPITRLLSDKCLVNTKNHLYLHRLSRKTEGVGPKMSWQTLFNKGECQHLLQTYLVCKLISEDLVLTPFYHPAKFSFWMLIHAITHRYFAFWQHYETRLIALP